MVTILGQTTKKPITLIGKCAGVCWGADTHDDEKNYRRGLSCIESGHGRTLEVVDIFSIIDGYSAKVIREWYTHIGGSPTRLQESTRYINYSDFSYVIPPEIESNPQCLSIYNDTMNAIKRSIKMLDTLGVKCEDVSNLLPLGMTTKIFDKRNVRNVIDMSRNRMCSRAYHEYRKLFNDYIKALSDYSPEWRTLVTLTMAPKCDVLGHCPEKHSCGRMPKKST